MTLLLLLGSRSGAGRGWGLGGQTSGHSGFPVGLRGRNQQDASQQTNVLHNLDESVNIGQGSIGLVDVEVAEEGNGDDGQGQQPGEESLDASGENQGEEGKAEFDSTDGLGQEDVFRIAELDTGLLGDESYVWQSLEVGSIVDGVHDLVDTEDQEREHEQQSGQEPHGLVRV